MHKSLILLIYMILFFSELQKQLVLQTEERKQQKELLELREFEKLEREFQDEENRIGKISNNIPSDQSISSINP